MWQSRIYTCYHSNCQLTNSKNDLNSSKFSRHSSRDNKIVVNLYCLKNNRNHFPLFRQDLKNQRSLFRSYPKNCSLTWHQTSTLLVVNLVMIQTIIVYKHWKSQEKTEISHNHPNYKPHYLYQKSKDKKHRLKQHPTQIYLKHISLQANWNKDSLFKINQTV